MEFIIQKIEISNLSKRDKMSDVHDATYYGKCMVGGIFACGLTHAAVCPLDIVKCRRQVSFFFFLSTNKITIS